MYNNGVKQKKKLSTTENGNVIKKNWQSNERKNIYA